MQRVDDPKHLKDSQCDSSTVEGLVPKPGTQMVKAENSFLELVLSPPNLWYGTHPHMHTKK